MSDILEINDVHFSYVKSNLVGHQHEIGRGPPDLIGRREWRRQNHAAANHHGHPQADKRLD